GPGARRRRRLLNAGAAGAAGARRRAAAVPGGVVAGSERVADASVATGRKGILPRARGAVPEALVSATSGASWEAISVSEAASSDTSAPRGADTDADAEATACLAGSSRAAAGAKTVVPARSGAKAVSTTRHAAGSARATVGSDAATSHVGGGAKAVAFTGRTGSETVPTAAAFVELHAVDVLDAGPAVAQLLLGVLPGRGAGGEGRGQVDLHP
ncbi:unnamed protein product, partial [Urochloa humidicola]